MLGSQLGVLKPVHSVSSETCFTLHKSEMQTTLLSQRHTGNLHHLQQIPHVSPVLFFYTNKTDTIHNLFHKDIYMESFIYVFSSSY